MNFTGFHLKISLIGAYKKQEAFDLLLIQISQRFPRKLCTLACTDKKEDIIYKKNEILFVLDIYPTPSLLFHQMPCAHRHAKAGAEPESWRNLITVAWISLRDPFRSDEGHWLCFSASEPENRAKSLSQLT